uniref:SXP/RAL-2 family protein Ani s 5-like cation-binding domain-containing protein n=1 Tax=Ditylenchus dipsaci TaxID=166011 RepID=A0A915D062_9BILA
MSSRCCLALVVAAVCLVGAFARPQGVEGVQPDTEDVVDAPAGVQHDAPPTGSSPPPPPQGDAGSPPAPPPGGPPPPQGGSQMLKSLKDAGMPIPQFFESMDNTSKALFFSIKKNTTLSKGQMVSAIQNFIQSQPQQIQNQYNEWLSNVTTWKNEMIAKIKSNLTGEPLALANQIISYMEDQSITNPETCKLIMGALKNVSHNVTAEVRQAVLANGIGHGPEAMAGPTMGGPGGPPGGMGGPMGMCSAGGPQVMHDGPGGHFGMVHSDDVNNKDISDEDKTLAEPEAAAV